MWFTRDDYVMNSSNMWLPINEKKELIINLWTKDWPQELIPLRKRGTLTLEDVAKWVEKKHDDDEEIYAQFYILGYR